MGLPPKWSQGKYRRDCTRCGHSSDWHRLDDSSNVSPTDPNAKFGCLGFDPMEPSEADWKNEILCDCKNMEG